MNKRHKIIHVPEREIWFEDKEEFVKFRARDIEIEHSLCSIYEWESKYHKPFLSSEKTGEETLDYMKMMVISGLEGLEDAKDIDLFFATLPEATVKEIAAYIDNPMTATTISEDNSSRGETNKEIITAELIYYWMTTQNIPFECEMWHINRLITLVKVCAIKNQPDDKKQKKLTSSDLALRRARMQAARAKYRK